MLFVLLKCSKSTPTKDAILFKIKKDKLFYFEKAVSKKAKTG